MLFIYTALQTVTIAVKKARALTALAREWPSNALLRRIFAKLFQA